MSMRAKTICVAVCVFIFVCVTAFVYAGQVAGGKESRWDIWDTLFFYFFGFLVGGATVCLTDRKS